MREVFFSKRNAMISTILVSGKQFAVRLGSRLRVEKLPLKQGDFWLGKEVLAIQKDSGEVVFGEPFISKAQVKARIVRHGKAKKVLILKKNRRKGYRRTLGHRQSFTEIHIEALSDSTGQWTTKQKSTKEKKLEKTSKKAKIEAKSQQKSKKVVKKTPSPKTKKTVKKRGS